MMKRLFLLLSLSATPAIAQTACTVATPCVQIPIVNSNTLPVTTVIWKCMGGLTTCSQTALSTASAGVSLGTPCPSVNSTWGCVAFSQSAITQAYNDPEPYGALMNYAVQAVTQGGVSALSPISTFQMPEAAPVTPSIGAITFVTTGGTGLQ